MHCHRSDTAGPGRQGGAALVVALLVFALCAALIVAMKSEFTLFYQRGANLFQGEQAWAYLRGAEELAAMALVLDYDQDQQREQPRDDPGEVWAQESAPYALDDGGWLVGNLQDLQGRFNLNALLPPTGGGEDSQSGQGGDSKPRFSAAQMQFIRLLQTFEEPIVSQQEAIQVTESIGDWLDQDSSVLPNGAEDDFYFGRTPAHRAGNRPMTSVSELRAVANVTPELYCALLPLVTVWPQSSATLNIHTAPAELLRTVNAEDDLSPLDKADGEALAAQRGDTGFGNMEEFLSHPSLEGKNLGQLAGSLGESSSYFRLAATVEVADRTTRLYSVLHRDGRQVRSLARNSGAADPLCARSEPRDGGDEELDDN